MKKWIILSLFFLSIFSRAESSYMEGYIFTYNGHDFITEHLGTTFPQYKINWSKKNSTKLICKSEVPGKCRRYRIQYVKQSDEKGRTRLVDVKIIETVRDEDRP